MEGLIFDIQRFSVHDGPGIRTLVFMKGCPLRCRWCANPEGQLAVPELMFIPQRCIGCGKCLEVCPHGALSKTHGPGFTDRSWCKGCGKCAVGCPAKARVISGTCYTVDQVLEIVKRDQVFYLSSGGGLTVGGGEPLNQPIFVSSLLERSQAIGIHTAIETSGFGEWAHLEKILPFTDLVYYDLKHMDGRKHRQLTGANNRVILDNAVKVADFLQAAKKKLIIRIPLISGMNDDPENITAACIFVRDNLVGVEQIELLPFHRYGEVKYTQLGRPNPFEGMKTLPEEKLWEFQELVESYGLKCILLTN